MTHEELKELAEAYSLGALDSAEKEAFESHLAGGCAECLEAVTQLSRVTASLAHDAEPHAPPPELKERILASVDDTSQRPAFSKEQSTQTWQDIAERLRRWRLVAFSLGTASAVFAIALIWTAIKWDSERTALENRVSMGQQVILQLQEELAGRERILRIMQSPQVKLTEMRGLELSPDASGKVVWDPEAHDAVFYGTNLSSIPSDKDYQLWMLRGNQPVSAAIFSPDDQGNSIAEFDTIEDDENLTAFAITLEPKGGVPQPTGDMYLIGTL